MLFRSSLIEGHREVVDYIAGVGGVKLVIVDTSAAFFIGQDENANTELGDYARKLRRLTELPGHPAVVVPCHPVKKPQTQSDCLPRGGGAFIAEVDGNLVLWPAGDNVELNWAGKFRGPPFDPVIFALKTVEAASVRDAKGRPIKSVIATEVDAATVQAAETREQDDLRLILFTMERNPSARKPTAIAEAAGLLSHVGTEEIGRAHV